MKVCPTCRTSYDDDVDECESDGDTLIDADEDAVLPENPELKDVVQVRPDEATSMIDLEAMEDKIRERLQQKASDDKDRAAQAVEDAKRLDPDVTGTIDLDALERKKKEKAEKNDDKTSPQLPEHTLVTREKGGEKHTQVVQRPSGKPGGASTKDEKKRSKLLVPLILVSGVLVAVVGGGTLFFLLKRGEPLTVMSVPPGATVTLDGSDKGTAPSTFRTAQGAHTIELTLDGYEPFKEIIDVPEGGLTFREPLKALPASEVKNTTASTDAGVVDGGEKLPATADDIVARAMTAITDGAFDEALTQIKELLKTAPDDKRSEVLLSSLTNAKTASAANNSGTTTTKPRVTTTRPDRTPPPPNVPPAERQEAARASYSSGEQAYNAGRFDDAKLRFKEAIQLDSKSYLPHRSLARIYEREGNVKQAKYHLKRYLQLGGPDADLKVRRWLDAHP